MEVSPWLLLPAGFLVVTLFFVLTLLAMACVMPLDPKDRYEHSHEFIRKP